MSGPSVPACRRVVVAIPHGGAISPEWLVGWERVLLPPDTITIRAARLPVHQARNLLVATALAQVPDITHLFFLDDDVILPPDGLLRLLTVSQEHDAPVVTGLCTQRQPPYLPCVYHQAPDGHYVHLAQVWRDDAPLQEVDACGAACLLIRTDVLRVVACQAHPETPGQPWFAWGTDGFGEDLTFCRRARAAGARIAFDPTVRCTHLGILDATYERFLRELVDGGVSFASPDLAGLAAVRRPWPIPLPAIRDALPDDNPSLPHSTEV